jgi:spore maturation protein CgeB
VRWLVCEPGPAFSVADCYVGYVEALRAAGEQVAEFPLGSALSFYDQAMFQFRPGAFRKAVDGKTAANMASDRLAGALYKVRPDVLFIISGFFVDFQLLERARLDGVKVVTLHTEEPYEHQRELSLAAHADLALLTDPVNIAEFRDVTNAEHFGHAYRPTVHHPGTADPVRACDFAFVGTGYDSRIRFLEAMNLDGLDVTLAGNWQQLTEDSPLRRYVVTAPDECLDNADTAELYRSAKVGLNLYRREGESAAGWAIGPREVEMAACGLPFVRDPRPETDELLPMLPVFHTPEEAGEQLRWLLAHDHEREALASKAREAIADRTFDHLAARLLRLLEKE